MRTKEGGRTEIFSKGNTKIGLNLDSSLDILLQTSFFVSPGCRAQSREQEIECSQCRQTCDKDNLNLNMKAGDVIFS